MKRQVTRNAFVAGAMWLASILAMVHAAEPTLPELIAAAKTGAEGARVQAIDHIGLLGDHATEAVPALSQMLGDSSASVRAHTLRTLGMIGAASKPAVPAIANLLKDPNEAVRRQAITALIAIRPGAQVMVPLVVQMLEESDTGVQVRILNAVAEAGADAVPGLLEALKTDKGAFWACLVLREIGPVGKDAVPALTEKLKDRRPEIRREAALALGAMEAAAEPALPGLGGLLDDEHARTAATFAIAQIGKMPAGADAKIKANAAGKDPMLSSVSYWALARSNPTDKALHLQAAEKLIERLKDKDVNVRAVAARALSTLPPAPEIMVPLWEKLLQTADEQTIQNALNVLAGLGPAAVPRMIDMLKYESLRPQVIYLLSMNGPAAAPATEALSKLLTDADDRVAAEAALALGSIGPAAKSAVPALVAALNRQDCPNIREVAFALGKIGPDSAPAEAKLSTLINDPDRAVAITAAWALVQIHPTSAPMIAKALPILIAGLGDSHTGIRHAAAETLGTIGPAAKSALPALQLAANDGQKSVRDAAKHAIASINAPNK